MGSDNGFNSFLQKEKKLQERLKKGAPRYILTREEMQEFGVRVSLPASNSDDYDDKSYYMPSFEDDDYLEHYCEWSRENPDDSDISYSEWLHNKFAPNTDPVKLFDEFPLRDLREHNEDIHHENDYVRNLNRKANVAFNLYSTTYNQLKKNYPESYENGAIEVDVILAAVAHYITAVIEDIVHSGAYNADGALEVFYAYLAENYQYLVEHSKKDEDIKIFSHIKTIRLWKY